LEAVAKQQDLDLTKGDFHAFPSIRGFANICKEIAIVYPWPTRPTITFRSKVKLHGTNAGVRIYADGRVVAQKRTDDISVEDDNAGFAAWVDTMHEYFSFLGLALADKNSFVVLHGEWAGPGVQKKAAVASIPEKAFFVFSMETKDGHVVEPEALQAFLETEEGLPARVHVIPWHSLEVSIDFNDREDAEKLAERMNEAVAQIDKIDPYIKDLYGIEGVGEGLVFYPRGENFLTLRAHNGLSLLFKVKGTSHGEKGAGKAARTSAVPSAGAMEFARTHVHEDRLEQGLQAVCGTELPTMKHIGPFLGWIGRDVEKETIDEREASGLDWKKDCAGPVALAARTWLLAKINAVTL